jgi:quercetin dioxygenase-like cupin family protein
MSFAFTRTRVVPWTGQQAPNEESLRLRLQEERLTPLRWTAAAFETFAPHAHSYDKIILVVSGEILFGLLQEAGQVRLRPGDRLELPAYIVHDAVAGPAGVVCLEAHRTIGSAKNAT